MFVVSKKDQEIKIRNMGRLDAYFVTVQAGEIQFMLRELGSKYAVHFSINDNVQTAEVLAVAGKSVVTQEFEREESGKFVERIKQIIPKETIVQLLLKEFTLLEAPASHPLYDKHPLIAPFVEMLFIECENEYQSIGPEKRDFETYLEKEYNVELIPSEEMEIILAKVVTAMKFLHLTEKDVAKEFFKNIQI